MTLARATVARIVLCAFAFWAGCGGDDAPGNPCAGVDCGQGTCIADGASARCACDDGYEPQGLRCVPEGGTDADTDTDTDGDTDADTDTDTDTGPCIDGDEDGACVSDDCNDDDPEVHPGADDNPIDWVTEEVDAEGTTQAEVVGEGTAVHIAYLAKGRDAVRYTTNAAGGWTFDTIEDVGRELHGVALALDSTGAAHVAYSVDDGAGDAYEVDYATNASGGWDVPETHPTGGLTIPDVTVDSGDQVYLSYTDCIPVYVEAAGTPGTVVRLHEGESCVDPTTGIAVGDQIYVAYTRGGNLFVDRSGNGFAANVWGAGIDARGQLTFDPLGELAAAWPRNAAGGPEVAAYLPHVSFGNEFRTPGGISSLAFAVGAPMLAVVDGDADVVLWTQTSSGWRSEEVHPDSEPSVSIAATDDALHVVYLDGGLQYARRALGDGIDQNCDGQDGVDADGDGHASYETWGDDCDDANPEAFPGSPDIPGGLDLDCDGNDG